MNPNIPSSHYDSTAAKTIQLLIDTCDYKSYLELGCRSNTTFNQIRCEHKIGVDKNPGGTLRMTTDDYFAKHTDKFDIIFVDAGHTHPQVMRDVVNARSILNPGGTIVMHDCWPYTPEYERKDGGASGTVWRAYVHLRTDPNLDVVCSNYDHGVGLVRVDSNKALLTDVPPMDLLTYDDLSRNLKGWLDPQSWDDIQSWVKERKR